MGEPKAFASLSSGLLARKGAARPAMRPQGFGQVGAGLDDLGWNDMGFEAPKPALRNPLAALTPSLSPVASPVHDQQAEIADRFSSYTEDSPAEEYEDETAEIYDPAAESPDGDEEAGIVPVLSVKPVRTQPVPAVPVAEAPARVAEVHAIAARAPSPRAAAGSKAKAAFTLRLDAARHLKLRLACAVSGRSAQQMVTEALDRLLDSMPELDAMADRAPAKRANR